MTHEEYVAKLREKVQFSGLRICFCAFPKPAPGTVCGNAGPGANYCACRCEICKGIIVQSVR